MWNLTATTLKSLEGFQMQAARHMAQVNKPRRGQDGCWIYPAPATVLAEVGLQSIVHYVNVRQQRNTRFIINQPIFSFCRKDKWKRGTSPIPWW